jgi:hypothetical protein
VEAISLLLCIPKFKFSRHEHLSLTQDFVQLLFTSHDYYITPKLDMDPKPFKVGETVFKMYIFSNRGTRYRFRTPISPIFNRSSSSPDFPRISPQRNGPNHRPTMLQSHFSNQFLKLGNPHILGEIKKNSSIPFLNSKPPSLLPDLEK